MVRIFHQDFNRSFIKYQSPNLGSALGSILNFNLSFDLSLPFKMHMYLLLLPDSHVYKKCLAVHIQYHYNKFFWMNNLDLLDSGQSLISGVRFPHECFFAK